MGAPGATDGLQLRVKELEEQVRQMRSAVVLAFNQLLDLRDVDTACHSTQLDPAIVACFEGTAARYAVEIGSMCQPAGPVAA